MGRNVAIGIQDFEKIIESKCFYVDKTSFIKEWWESKDEVTLIARPRRFGKTLNMSMLNCFFSNQYANRGDLFEGLSIWEDEKYRELQGTYPVINLSFALVKGITYEQSKEMICQILTRLYSQFDFLLDGDFLNEKERAYFQSVDEHMSEAVASMTLHSLSSYLCRYYGKKVIILLDEYDTPMQEAYVNGFWDEFTAFIRNMFNATFKTNPYLERAVMTGITRVSKESIFSDLNNLEVVTTTSDRYVTAFGFTEEEVFTSMDELGMTGKEEVKQWYDGFTFGNIADIYNPWSIINYLAKGKLGTYWANTSSNSLVGKLLQEGNVGIKDKFKTLIEGGTIESDIDEQIVYNQLGKKKDAIWSLLLASGYLKVVSVDFSTDHYELKITNYEVERMFRSMILDWFSTEDDAIVIEFKVFNHRREQTLEDTVASALAQIEEKQYVQALMDKGIAPEHIRKYGVAFQGKKVLIG